MVTKDEERGIEYDAYTVHEHKTLDKKLIEELKEKTLATNAKPVIYPILADAKLNSAIAVDFRDRLQRSMCNFLVDENDGDDYLTEKNKEFMSTDDVNLKVWYLHPYKQFSETINETVNLEFSVVSGNIKLETVGTARKDRYTSCSYGGYYVSLLEIDLLKEYDSSETDLSNFVKHANGSANRNPNSLTRKIFR